METLHGDCWLRALCPPLRTRNSSHPTTAAVEGAGALQPWHGGCPAPPSMAGQGWCSALCPAHCKGTDGDTSGQQEEAPSGLSIHLAAPRTPTRQPSTARAGHGAALQELLRDNIYYYIQTHFVH